MLVLVILALAAPALILATLVYRRVTRGKWLWREFE